PRDVIAIINMQCDRLVWGPTGTANHNGFARHVIRFVGGDIFPVRSGHLHQVKRSVRFPLPTKRSRRRRRWIVITGQRGLGEAAVLTLRRSLRPGRLTWPRRIGSPYYLGAR